MTDYTELSNRLRLPWFTNGCESDARAAADAIETLLKERDEARQELEKIADVWEIMWREKHKEARADWLIADILHYVREKDCELDGLIAERADAIAEAVMAEREACAKIAENTVIGNADEDIFGPADLRARRIMRAIRSR